MQIRENSLSRKIKSFKQFLTEAGKMLDISIKNIDKVVKNDKLIKEFIGDVSTIEEKFDGTKITAVRNDQPFSNDFQDNWILAYKGNILYQEEFDPIDDKDVKSHSIGLSQYKFVVDHFKKIHSNTKSVPKNTEFFIEFIMNKDTLTRDYKFKHGLVMIGYAPTKYEAFSGKLITNSGDMIFKGREKYADALSIDVPPLIFKGKLDSIQNFKKGIQVDTLMQTFEKYSDQLDYSDLPSLYDTIKKIFTEFNSKFGGRPEGVVINNKMGILKILAADQHDKTVRDAIKDRYRMSREEENAYFKEVHTLADKLVKKIEIKSLPNALKQASTLIYKMSDIPIAHEKKNLIQKKDDLYYTIKDKIIRRLEGNNNVYFQGKFVPPTKAHFSIVEKMLKNYDKVIVGIVRGRSNKDIGDIFSYDVVADAYKKQFGNKVRTLKAGDGNIIGYLNKSDFVINAIVAGTDRKAAYENTLKTNYDVEVIEIPRTDEDISATKVRQAIKDDDYATYKKMIAKPFESKKFFTMFQEKFVELESKPSKKKRK